ncbi:MAG: PKD domain-containing protein [Bacteroidia bacterium]|nr:PKD domain-containing protein [Bacteroidia bacterium]
MLRNLLMLTAACLAVPQLSAQPGCDGSRYRLPVFPSITVTSDVQYGTGRHDWRAELLCSGATQGALPPYTAMLPLKADLYEPAGDTLAARPLVIYVHGGAFGVGDKADAEAVFFCGQMALRGYVAASINYRLSLCGDNVLVLAGQINSGDHELIRAAYRAMQDAKAAVRYFRANAQAWRIDTSQIYLAGYSAGAITALAAGVIQEPGEKYALANALPSLGSLNGQLLYPDLGPIEGEGGNPGFSSKVRAVFAAAGALLDLGALDPGTDPPISMIHGLQDEIVPAGAACAFPEYMALGLITNCVPVKGSARIHAYSDSVGYCHEFLALPAAGHALSPAEADTAVQRAARLFYRHHCETPVLTAAQTAYQRCAGAPVQLAVSTAGGGSPLSYQWFRDGQPLPQSGSPVYQIPAVSPADFGSYQCRVAGPGCVTAVSPLMTLSEADTLPLVLEYELPGSACLEPPVLLSGPVMPGLQYAWLRNGSAIPQAEGPSYLAGLDGAYALQVTDSNGCVSRTAALAVRSVPDAAAAFTYAFDGDTLRLTNLSQHGLSYWWEFGDGATSALPQPQHVYAASGTYTLRLTVADSCGGASEVSETVAFTLTGLDAGARPLRLYPNPAAGTAYVELPDNLTFPAELLLYGADGRRCWAYRIIQGQASVALPGGLPAGLYQAEVRAGAQRWRSAWLKR